MENTNDPNMITHYICAGGCGGVEPEPGMCQTASCPKYKAPLSGCSCTDGGHQKQEESKEPEAQA